jgi:O-antigen ligase
MFLSRLRWIALFLVVVSAPFLWLPLGGFAGLSLKPIHLSLGLTFLTILLGGSRRIWHDLFSGDSLVFVVLYGAYLLWYVLSLGWTPLPLVALPGIAKNILYFVCFLALTVMIANIVQKGNFVRVAGFSALAGVLSFAIYMVVIFAIHGYNVIGQYVSAILAADANRLQFWFYPSLFNFSSASNVASNAPSTGDFTTGLRNTVLGGIVIEAVLLLMWRQDLKNRLMQIVALSVAGLAVLLVLLSVSRSNIIVLAISLLLPFAIRIGHKLRYVRREMLLIPISLVLIALGGAFVLSRGQVTASVIRILQDRFGILANDPRLVMYDHALSDIEQNNFLGYGFGKQVTDSRGVALRVHNVFLASWIETGVLGLFLSLAWYAVLIVRLFSGIASQKTWAHGLYREWALAFLILPMLRVLESGAGTFTLIEWLALAIYWGIWIGSKTSLARPMEPVL